VTILWLYGAALLGSAVLGGVMRWLWGDRPSCTTRAEAEQFVRDVADPKATDDPARILARARELVAQWDGAKASS
jgi:hypothetical protein